MTCVEAYRSGVKQRQGNEGRKCSGSYTTCEGFSVRVSMQHARILCPAVSYSSEEKAPIRQFGSEAYFLNSDTKLGYDAIREIFETGFSFSAQ